MIQKRRFPWVARQDWQDILFIHTPVSDKQLRSIVPAPFKIEQFAGSGWVSIVIFKATNSRLRFMPAQLSYPAFYQMNFRTYVKFGHEPGVYFFSLNTNDPIVNQGGKLVSMPFSDSTIHIKKKQETVVVKGRLSWQMEKNMMFNARSMPRAASFTPKPDTLSHFLTERYCIWMLQGNRIVKAPIHHSHWKLHDADLTIDQHDGLPFDFAQHPLAHYTTYKQAYIHPFETYGIRS